MYIRDTQHHESQDTRPITLPTNRMSRLLEDLRGKEELEDTRTNKLLEDHIYELYQIVRLGPAGGETDFIYLFFYFYFSFKA